MRIISGSAKGASLKPPAGTEIRPTADRVKEAMFSIVQFALPGSLVLDLFSGTGQLGLEALSRGARKCVFADAAEEAVRLTRLNAEASRLIARAEILRVDWQRYLESCGVMFDIAFIDPPYGAEYYEKLLAALSPRISAGGRVVCEHGKERRLPDGAGGLVKVKTYVYGGTAVTCYRPANLQPPK